MNLKLLEDLQSKHSADYTTMNDRRKPRHWDVRHTEWSHRRSRRTRRHANPHPPRQTPQSRTEKRIAYKVKDCSGDNETTNHSTNTSRGLEKPVDKASPIEQEQEPGRERPNRWEVATARRSSHRRPTTTPRYWFFHKPTPQAEIHTTG